MRYLGKDWKGVTPVYIKISPQLFCFASVLGQAQVRGEAGLFQERSLKPASAAFLKAATGAHV